MWNKFNLPAEFRLACIARLHSNHKYQMGAVIFQKRPVAVGFNYQKTHPIFSDGEKFWSIHAEMNCLLHRESDIYGGHIYVYRETRNGLPAMAKPCKNCMVNIIEAGISRIYYTVPKAPYYDIIYL